MTCDRVPLKFLADLNPETLTDSTDPAFSFGYIDIGSTGRGELRGRPAQVTFSESPSRARRVLRAGDSILSTVRTYLRAAWTVPKGMDPLVASTGFLCLRPTARVDARYLGWLVQSDVVIEEVVARSVGVSYPAISPEEVGRIEVPCPAERQQKAVADYLDQETARIDSVIAAKRRMRDLMEERFDAAVFCWTTGADCVARNLKPTNLDWIDAIPADWSTPTVGANFQVQLGKMLNATAATGPNQLPYLRNINVQWDRIDVRDVATMHFDAADRRLFGLRDGDLLVCEGGEVGRAAIWHDDLTECYFQKALHRVRPLRDANPRYLMYCLWAAAKRGVFAVEGNLSTIVHLTREQLKAHRFPWPPPTEQARIVERLDRLRNSTTDVIGGLRRQITLLQERRSALISTAVTGQLDLSKAA